MMDLYGALVRSAGKDEYAKQELQCLNQAMDDTGVYNRSRSIIGNMIMNMVRISIEYGPETLANMPEVGSLLDTFGRFIELAREVKLDPRTAISTWRE